MVPSSILAVRTNASIILRGPRYMTFSTGDASASNIFRRSPIYRSSVICCHQILPYSTNRLTLVSTYPELLTVLLPLFVQPVLPFISLANTNIPLHRNRGLIVIHYPEIYFMMASWFFIPPTSHDQTPWWRSTTEWSLASKSTLAMLEPLGKWSRGWASEIQITTWCLMEF